MIFFHGIGSMRKQKINYFIVILRGKHGYIRFGIRNYYLCRSEISVWWISGNGLACVSPLLVQILNMVDSYPSALAAQFAAHFKVMEIEINLCGGRKRRIVGIQHEINWVFFYIVSFLKKHGISNYENSSVEGGRTKDAAHWRQKRNVVLVLDGYVRRRLAEVAGLFEKANSLPTRIRTGRVIAIWVCSLVYVRLMTRVTQAQAIQLTGCA